MFGFWEPEKNYCPEGGRLSIRAGPVISIGKTTMVCIGKLPMPSKRYRDRYLNNLVWGGDEAAVDRFG